MASKTETIDSRILRLIGQDDVFDLDYGTYASLLKEALVKYGVIGKSKIPTEEIELLREEYKRVRKEEGRFKVKSKKINLGNLPTLKISNKTAKVSAPKLLPAVAKPSADADVEDKKPKVKKPKVKKDTLESLVASIKKSVISIEKTLLALNALTKSQIEKGRKETQRTNRSKREGEMEEKKPSMLGNVAKKIIKPFENIFEKIFRFVFFTLLGNAVTRIIEWWNDKENKKKIDTIFRFLKDHWPTITAAVLLFGTGFGRMTLRLGFMIAKFAFKITRFIIPKLFALGKSLLKFAVKNPLLAVGGLVVGAAAVGIASQSLKPSDDPEKSETSGDSPSKLFAGGGKVPGSGSTDTIPAMLTPGEFVMSKGAVNAFGSDTFSSMNAAGGGTNKPKTSSGTVFAQGGGYIGEKREKPPSSGLRKGSPVEGVVDAGSRLNQLMKSTNPERISKYDAKYGEGSYEKKLLKKLELIHGSIDKIQKTGQGGRALGSTTQRGGASTSAASFIGPPAPTSKSTFTAPGVTFGGGNNQRAIRAGERIANHQNYAAAKGKYYDVRDQKTYGNKNDADAAYKSRMIKLASQQGLDRLSNEGRGKEIGMSASGNRIIRSKGKRFDAQDAARAEENKKRGGWFGQLSRSFTGTLDRLGGNPGGPGGVGKSRYDAADKASEARVKQAGAEAIGRYYSSSDGKYYKDYAAASKAREKRLAKLSKQQAAQKKDGKAGGGMINVTENLGFDVPGGGADRQFLPGLGYLQPGEKLVALTKDAVDRGGAEMVNSVNARLDSNSNAWKDGVKPLPTRSNSSIDLPPEFLDQSSKDSGSSGSGSEVPEYDTNPPSGSSYRAQVKSYYGIA